MKRNEAGALLTVREDEEIAGPCVCGKCGRTWIPSPAPGDDCYRVADQADGGESPLKCERCQDADWRAEGKTIIDLSTQPPEAQEEIALRLEAANGNPIALYNLGLRFFSGSHGEKDEPKGAQWIGKAAEAGLPKAQLMLSGFYAAGLGDIEQDADQAASWAAKAADQEHPPAYFTLARFHEDGFGVTQDFQRAAELFRKAYNSGITEAKQCFVACLVKMRAHELTQDPVARQRDWTKQDIIAHADELASNTVRQEQQDTGKAKKPKQWWQFWRRREQNKD